MGGRYPGPTRSERVYRALLKAYPKEFREEYGPHMIQAFGDLCRAEYGRAGAAGLVLVWVRTVLDLFRTAISERTRTAPGPVLVIPFAGSPRMVRWGGAAAIAGAICSLVSVVLTDFSVAYLDEPIFNALWACQDGGSGYSPFVVLLHPIVSELLGTLAGLFFTTAWIGLYALVARRSGRPALLGGALMCFGAAVLLAFAASNAYRAAVIFGGRLGQIGTDPLFLVVEFATPAFMLGTLLLGFAVARTRALGPWSVLPLLLLVVGMALRLVLLRLGLPVQDLPQAARDGAGTLVAVKSPTLATNLGWALLGWAMWRYSRALGARRDVATVAPQSNPTGE